ncbi:MAG: hypothetical protein DRR16_00690 [Candidatus Parabeggiatoa sp. nov. 3]|nr:MAG: hypothetical protein DRR00_03135 [Gammaproteobacteria bacterium]RKZ63738.1 MAG: hypothetical protein DRQ99_16535 [Gammaproteobacteria bacterium]RKZ90065.1 MAG: hypothetical protein DRR16_00690 [Gammaproteobacteria bacterium]
MSLNKRTTKENLPYLLSFIYPLLFIWQGLDVTDMGFSLSHYQLIFQDSGTFLAGYILWLTNVIGGLWWEVFGFLGVIGFKLLRALLIWGCFYLSYRLLRPYASKQTLGWALFITLIVVSNHLGNWFDYNTMTSLLYLAGALTLLEGLGLPSRNFLIASGFLLGISVFARFPNILGISLAAIIVIHGIVVNNQFRVIINNLLFFCLGVVMSFTVVFIIMEWLNHRQMFIEAVQSLFFQSENVHDSIRHSIDHLFFLFIKDQSLALLLGGACLLTVVAISAFVRRLQLQLSWFPILALTSGLALIALLGLWWMATVGLIGNLTIAVYSIWNVFWKWILTGTLYIILIAYVFGLIKHSIEYRILSLVALAVLVLVPLGSGNGIYNAIYGMWLALPIVLLFFLQGTTSAIKNWKLHPQTFDYGRIFIIVTLVLASVAQASFPYRDSKNRLEMTATIEHPLLRGVFTTPERAKVMQELLDELKNYVKPGDVLFAYEGISLVYFLTQTHPYLYNTWPMLEASSNFQALIKKAETKQPYYPIVVRAKASTQIGSKTWPHKVTELTSYTPMSRNRQLAEDFLKRHQYIKVWENSFFEILQPLGKHKS